jgi:hypothetical protein
MNGAEDAGDAEKSNENRRRGGEEEFFFRFWGGPRYGFMKKREMRGQ